MTKPHMPIHVDLERVSDNRRMFLLSRVLHGLGREPEPGGSTVYWFLMLLDAMNLLDEAMDSESWEELPYEIDLVLGPVPVLPAGSC